MADVKLEKTPCDRELIEKILAILEKHEKLLPQFFCQTNINCMIIKL